MDTLLQDLRYALRSLRRTPGFTFTVTAVMALGIGVNSFIFSAVRGILFADLPFGEPGRIVKIESLNLHHPDGAFEMSMPDLRDVIDRSRMLNGVAGPPRACPRRSVCSRCSGAGSGPRSARAPACSGPSSSAIAPGRSSSAAIERCSAARCT